MAAIRAAKKELRKTLKKALAEVSKESVTNQGSCIVKTLLSLPEYQSARRISVYLSMPSGEVQTAAIVRDALGSGKRVFIPYCYKREHVQAGQQKSIMDMLELESLKDYESLKPDSWGIPTPSKDSLQQRRNCFGGMGKSEGKVNKSTDDGLDLIVTPGLGFDRSRGRMGRGMGFYDEFFDRCSTYCQLTDFKEPWRVALALNEQVLPTNHTVPMDETDRRVDALILGDGSVLRPPA